MSAFDRVAAAFLVPSVINTHGEPAVYTGEGSPVQVFVIVARDQLQPRRADGGRTLTRPRSVTAAITDIPPASYVKNKHTIRIPTNVGDEPSTYRLGEVVRQGGGFVEYAVSEG